MMSGKEPTAVPAPLELQLLLQEGNLDWSPSLGSEAAGVGNTLLESVEYISKIGAAVERIDSEEGLVHLSSAAGALAQSVSEVRDCVSSCYTASMRQKTTDTNL